MFLQIFEWERRFSRTLAVSPRAREHTSLVRVMAKITLWYSRELIFDIKLGYKIVVPKKIIVLI